MKTKEQDITALKEIFNNYSIDEFYPDGGGEFDLICKSHGHKGFWFTGIVGESFNDCMTVLIQRKMLSEGVFSNIFTRNKDILDKYNVSVDYLIDQASEFILDYFGSYYTPFNDKEEILELFELIKEIINEVRRFIYDHMRNMEPDLKILY